MENEPVRLQKFLARAGVASRRKAEVYIADGRVKVNGKAVDQPGVRVVPGRDVVELDCKTVSIRTDFRTIMLHKPRGYICSTSSVQGKTIYSLLDGIEEKLLPVGRLDKNSEGLLLLTNDGNLANKLTHPRYEQEKTYHATVSGSITPEALAKLNAPMLIDEYKTRPASVRVLPFATSSPYKVLEIHLKEGRNRQIRKMCEQVELKIRRLIRVKIKNLELKGLPAGKWRDLTAQELEQFTVDLPDTC